MAAADYKLCDKCGGKAFYDADLSYEAGESERHKPFRMVGTPQMDDPAVVARVGYRLGYLGDWAVLCEDCAKTHKTAIVPIEE